MAGEIYIADKETLDKVNGSVGSNSDVASATGSVHAKLKDIKTSITSINTINTNVGSNSDSASSVGSVHAKIKDVKTSIGNTTDVTNETGSIHAKLKDIKEFLNNYSSERYTPFTIAGIFTPSSVNTWTLVYSHSGKGYISKCIIGTDAGVQGALDIRITIDSKVVYYAGAAASNTPLGIFKYQDAKHQIYGGQIRPNWSVSANNDFYDRGMRGVASFPQSSYQQYPAPIANDIYYNSNFKLELQTSALLPNGACYEILGGIF